jgi:AcrR family transcriptional regulator
MAEISSKRETIKYEATRLFVERGVDGTSMRDVAQACGMSPSNFYSHFTSKESLVSELFHDGYREYGALLYRSIVDKDFHEALVAVVKQICELHDDDNTRFRFLIMTQHSNLRDVAKDIHNPVEVIYRFIGKAMQDGFIPVREPEIVTAWLVGIIIQTATFRLYGRVNGRLSDRLDDLTTACLRVIS